MLTWNVTYYCKSGQREAFYKVLQDLGVRANSMGEEGCRQYDYFFSAEDPDVLLLVELDGSRIPEGPLRDRGLRRPAGQEGRVRGAHHHRQV